MLVSTLSQVGTLQISISIIIYMDYDWQTRIQEREQINRPNNVILTVKHNAAAGGRK